MSTGLQTKCPRCKLRLVTGTSHPTADDCVAHLVPRLTMAKSEQSETEKLRTELARTRESRDFHRKRATRLEQLIAEVVNVAEYRRSIKNIARVA